MQRKWEERRKFKRVPFLCEVECEGGATNRMNTRINDLSETGLFVDSMTCYPVGSRLKLRFKIKDVEINAAGEVRYCLQNVGMGIMFLDLEPEHLELIRSVVGD